MCVQFLTEGRLRMRRRLNMKAHSLLFTHFLNPHLPFRIAGLIENGYRVPLFGIRLDNRMGNYRDRI